MDRLAALAPALRAAARRHGTPLYVTDGAALDAAAEAVRAAFPDPWLRAYSLKANDVPAIVARVTALGFDANVVSRGEWALAPGPACPNAASRSKASARATPTCGRPSAPRPTASRSAGWRSNRPDEAAALARASAARRPARDRGTARSTSSSGSTRR